MSEMKALERLRTFGLDVCWRIGGWPKNPEDMANEIADAIEAEIAEHYMPLPVDADGVPIHMGDTLQLGDTRGEVVALRYCPSNGKLPWEWQCDTGDWYNTAFARHAKPRTLEDVLHDFARKAVRIGTKGGVPSDVELYADEDAVVECADEIRAMFGEVDA